MTEQAQAQSSPVEQPSLHQEQVALIRESLIRAVIEKYIVLVQVIKKLPIPQGTPGLQHALLNLDTAVLWMKEIIGTSPLALATPPATEEKSVSTPEQEEKPNVVDIAPNENQNAESAN